MEEINIKKIPACVKAIAKVNALGDLEDFAYEMSVDKQDDITYLKAKIEGHESDDITKLERLMVEKEFFESLMDQIEEKLNSF